MKSPSEYNADNVSDNTKNAKISLHTKLHGKITLCYCMLNT
jgi:hypothetical protein